MLKGKKKKDEQGISNIERRCAEGKSNFMRLYLETNENQHKRTAQHIGPPRRGVSFYKSLLFKSLYNPAKKEKKEKYYIS
jgi:hypothetical protein